MKCQESFWHPNKTRSGISCAPCYWKNCVAQRSIEPNKTKRLRLFQAANENTNWKRALYSWSP